MKYLSTFLFFFLVITLHSEFNKPELIWEKTITIYDISPPASRRMYDLGKNYLLHYDGFSKINPSRLNSGFYLIDEYGDTLKHFLIESHRFNHLIGFTETDNMYFFLFSQYYPEFFSNHPIIYKYDKNFVEREFVADTLWPFSFKFPIKFSDSLIFIGYDTSAQLYAKSFDLDLNFLNEIKLDTNGINIPHSWRTDPGFVHSNGNFTFIFTSNNYDLMLNEITDYGIIVQFDRKGKVLWSKKIESTTKDSTLIKGIFEDFEGNIVAISIARTGNDSELIIDKITPSGELIFEKVYPFDNRIHFYSIGELKYSKNIFVNGKKKLKLDNDYYDTYWFRLFDSKGLQLGEWNWLRGDKLGIISDIVEKDNGNLLLYGRYGYELFLAEMDSKGVNVNDSFVDNNIDISIYPNPVSSDRELNISFTAKNVGELEIEMINQMGIKIKKLYSGFIGPGRFYTNIRFEKDLSRGYYWVRIIINRKIQAVKPLIIY